MTKFHYLKVGPAQILGFVGVKMLIAGFFKIPVGLSLGVIATILIVAVAASLLRARYWGAGPDRAVEQPTSAG